MKKQSIFSKILNYLLRVKDPQIILYKSLAITSFISFLGVSVLDILITIKAIDLSVVFIDIPLWKEVLTLLLFFLFLYLLNNRVKVLDSKVDAVMIHQFTMPGFNVASFEHLYQVDFNIQRVRKISMDNDLTINGVFDGSGHKYVRSILALDSLLKDIELANKPIMYGGIALQPFAFLVGHIISNKVSLRKFDYNKTGSSWYEIDDEEYKNDIELDDDTFGSGNELSIVIASSEYPITRKYDKNFNIGGIATFQLNRNEYDSLSSSLLQKKLVSQIIQFVKFKRRERNIELVKLSFASQTSFSMELGRHWTLTELPNVIVLNFNVQKKLHEWGVEISSGHDPKFVDLT